jgi:hypothetical protein
MTDQGTAHGLDRCRCPVDEAVQQRERVVGLVVVAEVAVVAHDLGAAEPVEQGPPRLVIAAVRVVGRVDEVHVTGVRLDRRPVVRVLQYRLVALLHRW